MSTCRWQVEKTLSPHVGLAPVEDTASDRAAAPGPDSCSTAAASGDAPAQTAKRCRDDLGDSGTGARIVGYGGEAGGGAKRPRFWQQLQHTQVSESAIALPFFRPVRDG